MIDLLLEILNEFGYPIYETGSMGLDEEYPETFFTYWNNSSDDGSHYDNKARSYIWDFDVNVYSNDPRKIERILLETKERLIEEGFIVGGKGHAVKSDEITHTGRGINVQYIEGMEEKR